MIDLINLISNNGISVVCVAFMIYFINTTLKDNTSVLKEIQLTLSEIKTNMTLVNKRLNEVESKVKNKKEEI